MAGLERWANRGEWCPHYVALFTVIDSKPPRFSAKGRASRDALTHKTRANHVHVYAIDYSLVSETEVSIECLRLGMES